MSRDPAFEALSQLIKDNGTISFETFMDYVLYSEHGFYSAEGRIGGSGDFFTSSSLHPIFGSFLAIQIYAMWKALQCPNPFAVIEFGSGNGLLSKSVIDTIGFFDNKFASCCEYFAIDKFHYGETQHLRKFLAGSDVPITNSKGVIFSNELIDAFPVRLIQVSKGQILEVFLKHSSTNTLTEVLEEPNEPLPDHICEENLSALEGYRGPVNVKLSEWYDQLNSILGSGFLITIDYGFNQNEYYSMENSKKLIQTYYKHVQGSSPYQRLGRQDITAHADFTALETVGNKSGFSKVIQTTQREWLFDLGFDKWVKSQAIKGQMARSMENFINNLVDPNGLGKFKVLIQQKGLNSTFNYSSIINRQLPPKFKVPEVTKEYMAFHMLFDRMPSYFY